MVWRRFSIASLIFLILVTVASVILVYLVSPLRAPAFQPNSANAGTSVWWLKGVREDDWMWAAVIKSWPACYQFHASSLDAENSEADSSVSSTWLGDVVPTVLCVPVLPTRAVDS